MADVKRVRMALIGVGRIGGVHYNHMRRNFKIDLKFVVDDDVARAKECAAGVVSGECKALSSLEELLPHTASIDAAVVCTPTLTHFDIVMKLLAAGVNVFVEKPLSLAIPEIDAAYNLAKEKGVILLTGYQRRFDPNFGRVAGLVHGGQVGKVHLMRSTSRDNPVPSIHFLKTSGGILHDCGSHDIHLVRWVIAEDPTEVVCFGSCFNEEIAALEDCDTIVMSLRFPSGALATIDLSRHARYGYDQRIEVHATEGMLQAENQRPTTVVHSSENGRSVDANCYSFPQRYAVAYEAELGHFVDAILSPDVVLNVTHEDVRKVAIIADAATQALKSGMPVKIDYA